LHNIRLDDSGSITDLIKEIHKLNKLIFSQGCTLIDSNLVFYTLNALPIAYNNFKDTIDNMDYKLSFKELCNRLYSKEANLNTPNIEITYFQSPKKIKKMFSFTQYMLKLKECIMEKGTRKLC